MKTKREFIFLLGMLMASIFVNNLFAKPLPPDSALYLQDVPFYDGVDEFQTKLDHIRETENREPLGLVLCGGSARAFAHIGALKAMEENGVVPDFIVANSMGAIIGMFYAYGFSPDDISQILGEINLSSFFDPVVPLKGGILSVRYYRSFVNDLLGKESTDISECAIPILLLSEDLYTKRQVWHANGDFAKVMTAAFAMTVFMEPTRYTLSDGTDVDLIDSGAIDIGGLKIAHSFSENLIISTAFYDKKLNYNNPIVILNRTQSIGKERIAIHDIKELNPVLIRNDVEHFSFMDFHKQKELTEAGYASANDVMDEIVVCPHGKKDLSEARARTHVLAESEIKKQQQGQSVSTQEPYIGAKVRPNFASLDFPNYFLYDTMGAGVAGFVETPKLFARLGPGISFNSPDFSADMALSFKPNGMMEASAFASYSFDMSNSFSPSKFYVAGTFKSNLPRLVNFLDSFYITGEWLGSGMCVTQNIISTAGILCQTKKDEGYLSLKPYAFISGANFNALNFGPGVDVKSQVVFGSVGLSENVSGRYAAVNFASENPYTNLFGQDYYRAYTSRNNVAAKMLASSSTEIFYNNSDLGITISEFIMCQQLQTGAFFDMYYADDLNYCAGGFARLKTSLLGLKVFLLETGCGWNFAGNNPFGYFTIKNPF